TKLLINKDLFGIYLWELGGNIIPFRESAAGETFHDMDWSPDGRFIAYSSTELFRRCATCEAYYQDIFIDSLDRTVHRHLTAEFTNASSPDWAPDGQSIAFAADGEIFLFSLYANKAFNLTQHDANEINPKWSPDGRLIAFLSDREGLATLYVMNSDGLNVREVADLDINLYGEGPDVTQSYTYTWLPDGKQILYSSTTFTETSGSREYSLNNKLIDLETGKITDLRFPFEGSLAAWYMPSNLEIVSSYQTPPPFEPVSEIPPGEFLFVSLYDDDYTCLDGLCACPVPETPPYSFSFEEDRLLLLKYHFEPMPDDWIAFRRDHQASILYSFYSSQVAELRLFSSLPLTTPVGNFVISGVNSRGEIQVQTKEENTIIGVGRKAYSEEPEQKDPGCRVLHKYSLTNYGFIKDQNVKLVTGW
ncbi:MAG TPA: hypothetical protein VJM08_15290, partial [Anaerolineales bacterium]|nr:hypothetical protein [Anaerolineales bacterium]